jgi:5-methylthioadenosine/S-adenosylhomocysteine deaminase
MRNLADDLPLMAWLRDRVWPFESLLGAEDIAVGARLGIAEMLLVGTTTLVDMYWHEAAVAAAASDMGVRAVLCPTFIDGERMAEFERDLPETLTLAARCDRLSVRVAPHAAYSCSEENLRRGVDLARLHGLGLSIHLSETLDEQRIIRERFGRTPTEYLRDIGFFELPTIAAHGVHLSEGDMSILLEHGVTVSHNPQSNMKLASGAAPVARMIAAGLNVALGTDGASSNNDLDLWDEMRTASLLGKLTAADPSVLPAYEVLRMATLCGARAIGMEGSLGVVAEGALADLILLDIDKPHWSPSNDPIAALVYSAKAGDVESVFVDGRRVVSAGRVTGLDLEGVMHDAQKTADAVKRKL